MVPSDTIRTNDIASCAQPPMPSNRRRLGGRRAAMVVFSRYPFDPRPRRAVEALVREGMSVDLVCLGSKNAPWREVLNGIEVLRVPLDGQTRGGKLQYGYQYSSFILIASVIFALRSLTRRYDLVYVHNMPDILVLSSLVPKTLGAKVILDMHDPMPELMMTILTPSPRSWSVQ